MPSQALYELAAAFRKAKLWDSLSDSDLFGVRLPDGSVGYCCVMGQGGEHFALAVYPGDEGLSSYIALQDLSRESLDFQRFSAMQSMRCLQCSFETKDMLEEEDIAELQGYGLTYRGPHPWPQFRRYDPARLPWRISGADEEVLALCLRAGLDMRERIPAAFPNWTEEKREALLGALGYGEDSMPLLTPEAEGGFALSELSVPERIPLPMPSPELTETFLMARLKKQKVLLGSQWFFFLMLLPMLMEGEPPAFPTALFIVEAKEGILTMSTVVDYAEDHAELLDPVVDLFLEKGRPALLVTDDVRAYVLLRRLCEQMGQPIECAEEIGGLDELRQDVFMDMITGRFGPEDGAE